MISTKAGALFKHFKSIKFEVTRLNIKIYGNAQTSNQKFIIMRYKILTIMRK